MYQFGDGLIIEDPGAPLLIWIQLLVVFLLLSLLSSTVTLFSPDHPSPSSAPVPAAGPPSSSVKSLPGSKRHSSLRRAVVSRSRSRQEAMVVLGSQTAGFETQAVSAGSTGRVGIGQDGERAGLDRSSSSSSLEEEARHGAYHHPCYFVRLAGMAFIKCFGLDPT